MVDVGDHHAWTDALVRLLVHVRAELDTAACCLRAYAVEHGLVAGADALALELLGEGLAFRRRNGDG